MVLQRLPREPQHVAALKQVWRHFRRGIAEPDLVRAHLRRHDIRDFLASNVLQPIRDHFARRLRHDAPRFAELLRRIRRAERCDQARGFPEAARHITGCDPLTRLRRHRAEDRKRRGARMADRFDVAPLPGEVTRLAELGPLCAQDV